jgi:hypothetical protein
VLGDNEAVVVLLKEAVEVELKEAVLVLEAVEVLV